MRLAAIYNVFDGVELLKGSMERVAPFVDVFIIVYQTTSNFGEKYFGFDILNLDVFGVPVMKVKYIPPGNGGFSNEIKKRQIGIETALELKCTHFLHLDCDEYYWDFGRAKFEFEQSGAGGSVCRLFTYFKDPRFRCETLDNYYVPFIHKLEPNTITGVLNYPFYVDPTRRINELNVVLLSSVMHHFSYIRKDIRMKVRNSSAKKNIERSTLLQDYDLVNQHNANGFFVKGLNQNLTIVENIFNINI